MKEDKLKSRPLTAQDLGAATQAKAKKPTASASSPNKRTQNNNTKPAQNRSNNSSKPSNHPRGGKTQNDNRPNDGGKPNGNRPNGGGKPRSGGGGGQRRRFDKRPSEYMTGTFNKLDQSKTAAKAVGLSRADAGKLKIIPLGGLGQIGKNVMALEYENDMIVMDLGFMFPGPELPGIDYIIPDISYLEERKHKIRGHFITHAHLDHIGGIPFMLPKMPAPIYGAKFTVKFIERQLEEYKLPFKPEMHIVDQDNGQKIQAGVFSIEFVRVNHSIPDACALVIRTPAGTIFNTGDWRFDPDPYDGKPTDLARLKQIGDEGILLLMCDSTSCETMGRSPREQEITETLDEIFARNYNKRVIISSFSSQISRMQMIIDAVARAKRKMVITGRSMLSNVELAVKMGYIKIPANTIIRSQDVNKYQDGQVAILATGSQGEEFAVLNRMGRGEVKDIKIRKNDVVVLSSSIIPGNEKPIWGMIDNILRWGPYVYSNDLRRFDDLDIMHISGHAYYEEVEQMIKLIRPKYYLPIHGELHHLVHNKQICIRSKVVSEDKIFVIENGQTLVAEKGTVKLGAKIPVPDVLIDGAGIGDVQEIVLKDRIAMSEEGVFTVIATVQRKTGKLLTSPDIISRGFIYMKDNEELVNGARQIVKNIFAGRQGNVPPSSPIIKTRIRDEVSNYLYKVTKRNPIVLPVVIEV
ncbi:ribonuclease J [Candidatus Saccharibacteria bacterium]|nr:ribonuclease J [Candidatus Saccharibacteria bacterium]